MDHIKTLAALGIAMAHLTIVGGCKTFDGYPNRQQNVEVELRQLDRYYADDVLTEFYVTRADDPAAQRAWRDEVVNGRVRAIDLQYSVFVQNATAGRIAYNAATDITVLGLSAAGTLVPSAGAGAVLAAISGGLIGTRGIIDKEVLYEKTLPVLLQTMDAQRRVQLARIRIGLTAGPAEYPLLQALADVEAYYHAGTFPAAIIAINQAAGDKATAADAEIRTLYQAQFDPAMRASDRAIRD